MRKYGQPSGQLFPKRWRLSNPTRTKSIMNKHMVKHHRNSDFKTGNRDQIRTTALERAVMNYWGLKLVLCRPKLVRRQPHPRKALSREFCPACPWELVYADDTMIKTESMEELLVKLQTRKSLMKMKGLWVIMV